MIQGNLDAIINHGIRDYKSEACVLVFGTIKNGVKTVVEIVECENLQDKYHAVDPETFPRDSTTAYYIDPLKMKKLIKSVEERGLEFIAKYPSHPDHDSYFSPEDKEAATALGETPGEPSYPDASEIVVSIWYGKFKEIKSFRWDKEKKDYIQEEIKLQKEL